MAKPNFSVPSTYLTSYEKAKAIREFRYWTLRYKNRKRNPLCILHGKPVDVK